jgi:hypothetical protein
VAADAARESGGHVSAAHEERAWVDLREHEDRCGLCVVTVDWGIREVQHVTCELGRYYLIAWRDACRGIVRIKPRWVVFAEFHRPPTVVGA